MQNQTRLPLTPTKPKMTMGKTHQEKVNFIMENKDKMTRDELAEKFHLKPNTILKIILTQNKKTRSEQYFSIENEGSVYFF